MSTNAMTHQKKRSSSHSTLIPVTSSVKKKVVRKPVMHCATDRDTAESLVRVLSKSVQKRAASLLRKKSLDRQSHPSVQLPCSLSSLWQSRKKMQPLNGMCDLVSSMLDVRLSADCGLRIFLERSLRVNPKPFDNHRHVMLTGQYKPDIDNHRQVSDDGEWSYYQR